MAVQISRSKWHEKARKVFGMGTPTEGKSDVVAVDGTGTPDEVFARICDALGV